MEKTYPILQVPQDSVEDIEQMGTKNKFWFRIDDERWLFKEPRVDTGEHWAEKIAAEVGSLIGVDVARVELAIYDGLRGSASLSFAPKSSNRILHASSLGRELKDEHRIRHLNEGTVGDYVERGNGGIYPRNRS